MPTQKWSCEKCGKSFDSFQDAIDCERSHKSKPKRYQGSTPGRLANTGVSADNGVYLTQEFEQGNLRWGCHINIRDSNETKRSPDWVKALSSSYSWHRSGVVVWDENIRTIAHMRAADALELITDLQTNPLEAVTVVGQRNMKYSNQQLGEKPGYTLVNKNSLDTTQANELLRFLQANEPLLQEMAKEDKEQWDQTLRNVYTIFIRAYLRRKTEEGTQSQS